MKHTRQRVLSPQEYYMRDQQAKASCTFYGIPVIAAISDRNVYQAARERLLIETGALWEPVNLICKKEEINSINNYYFKVKFNIVKSVSEIYLSTFLFECGIKSFWWAWPIDNYEDQRNIYTRRKIDGLSGLLGETLRFNTLHTHLSLSSNASLVQRIKRLCINA